MSNNTQTYIYKWINPITNKEEILGTLIETKTLTDGSHGGRFQYTFDCPNNIDEFSIDVCTVSYNDKKQLIITGYIGMGMNYETGMSTINKV
jgi:hypothetical protein